MELLEFAKEFGAAGLIFILVVIFGRRWVNGVKDSQKEAARLVSESLSSFSLVLEKNQRELRLTLVEHSINLMDAIIEMAKRKE